VPGIRDALRRAAAPVLAVTPLVGGKALKGPAAKIMGELGIEVSPDAVARHYADLIDLFVYDESDPEPAPVGGVELVAAPTVMHGTVERVNLARRLLALAERAK
jgi:LPPG:FO 2-phospho-L-lactate transferase